MYSKELEHQARVDPDINYDYIKNEFECGMLVQREVKVKREFRLLCFPEEFLVYEREKQPGQFLGNLSHGSSPKSVNKKEIDTYVKPLLKKIRKMMQELKYPWLSVDIYIDDRGTVGIFEFQMEFAYEGFKHREVRNCMETSLKSFIRHTNTNLNKNGSK